VNPWFVGAFRKFLGRATEGRIGYTRNKQFEGTRYREKEKCASRNLREPREAADLEDNNACTDHQGSVARSSDIQEFSFGT